jgi:hypothetical protein
LLATQSLKCPATYNSFSNWLGVCFIYIYIPTDVQVPFIIYVKTVRKTMLGAHYVKPIKHVAVYHRYLSSLLQSKKQLTYISISVLVIPSDMTSSATQHCHAASLLHLDPHRIPSLELLHHHSSSYWSQHHVVNITKVSSHI